MFTESRGVNLASFTRRTLLKQSQNKRPARQQERSSADEERAQEAARREKSAESLRRLESYILEHKVRASFSLAAPVANFDLHA